MYFTGHPALIYTYVTVDLCVLSAVSQHLLNVTNNSVLVKKKQKPNQWPLILKSNMLKQANLEIWKHTKEKNPIIS